MTRKRRLRRGAVRKPKRERDPTKKQLEKEFMEIFGRALAKTPLEPIPRTLDEFKGSMVTPPGFK